MNSLSRPISNKSAIISMLLDVIALVFIYSVPSISHLVNFPVYLIEPMRVMLILSIAHTSKRNAYILALTMPVFSFVTSGHPEFTKMILITFELLLNVYLLYFLARKINNHFFAVFLSIIISKIAYYIIKYVLINTTLISAGLITTPLYIQLTTTIIFSLYLIKFYKNE